MKRLFSALLVALAVLAAPSASEAQTLFTVTNGDDQLRTVNPLTATTLSGTPITLAGSTVTGGTGLAVDPTTGTFWALLNVSGGGGRRLVTLNTTTGVATLVGNTGAQFAGIAFTSTGTLFGVTGDGEGTLVPETLYTLNKTTAAPTIFQTLGNGSDGEAIAFNPADGLMYHASGHIGAGNVIFENINLSTNAVTDIPIGTTPLVDEEAQALTWWGSQNVFLWKQNHGTGPLFRVTTSGGATLIGDLDHQAKGLAFSVAAVPEPTSIALVAGGLVCSGGVYWHRRRRAAKKANPFKRR